MTTETTSRTEPDSVGPVRTETGRARRPALRSAAPWVGSVLLHVALIAVVILLAGRLATRTEDEPRPVIVADLEAIRFDPNVRLEPPSELTVDPRSNAESTPAPSLETPVELSLDQVDPWRETDAGSMPAPASGDEEPLRFEPSATTSDVRFAGQSATNAGSIVFVIDASGSMVRSLQIVVGELERSLRQLAESQRFSVIFFQDDRALIAPPAGALMPAIEANVERTIEWVDRTILPRGGSNPMRALRAALALRPDAIFVLSENITGAGRFEVDQRWLLSELDRLNPVDPATGRRPTLIKCIQFLEPDPLDTLRRIAELHGGRDGYTFLDRRSLGLAPADR